MRWRFRNPKDAGENAARGRLETAIDGWWTEFARKTGDLHSRFDGRNRWDVGAWMAEHYQAIHEGLAWEFGPGLRGGHRLVMTPETDRHLRPLVAEMIRRAPRLDGWEFYPYRLPEPIEMAHRMIKARTAGDVSGSLCHVAPGEHNLLDLTFYYPRFTHEDDDHQHFFVAAETLLGEELLDKWIGPISVKPLAEAPKAADPLDALAPRVQEMIGQIQGVLPRTPCFQTSKDARWSILSLEPDDEPDEALGDYPRQLDIFVAKAMRLEMWQAAHCDRIFASERFSRVGETFCYVKLDGRAGVDEERFADKAEIEDALDAALIPAGLGCHVGGGTGRWYSYVDLALTNVDKGIEVVRRVLSAGNVSRRSWILFFDDEWAHEWVGIYDDSPPPPLIP